MLSAPTLGFCQSKEGGSTGVGEEEDLGAEDAVGEGVEIVPGITKGFRLLLSSGSSLEEDSFGSGSSSGSRVGVAEGSAVGAEVGSGVGEGVGSGVGAGVGTGVGSGVGSGVGVGRGGGVSSPGKIMIGPSLVRT